MKNLQLFVVGITFMIFQACDMGTNEKSAITPPVVPDISTMEIPEFSIGESALSKSTMEKTHVNATTAALAVTYWTGKTKAALKVPVSLYKACRRQTPEPLEDGNGWSWRLTNETVSGVLDSVRYSAKLTGVLEDGSVKWTMKISGPNFNDFVWFTGKSNATGTKGAWTFYDHDNKNQETYRFAYSLEDGKRKVEVKYIDASSPYLGAYLKWEKSATTLSMEGFNPVENRNHLITYNVNDGSGYHRNINTDTHHCWDTRENHFADVACQTTESLES